MYLRMNLNFEFNKILIYVYNLYSDNKLFFILQISSDINI